MGASSAHAARVAEIEEYVHISAHSSPKLAHLGADQSIYARDTWDITRMPGVSHPEIALYTRWSGLGVGNSS